MQLNVAMFINISEIKMIIMKGIPKFASMCGALVVPAHADRSIALAAKVIATPRGDFDPWRMRADEDQSVERRSSMAASGGFVSDLTGSILPLSTGGVTRAVTSTEPVCSGARSERG
jgi:hypothetical protein